MLSTWFDWIGNWNPQLFREIKGRLTRRNVGIVVALALVGQVLFMAYFYSELPLDNYYSRYCQTVSTTYECLQDADHQAVILWEIWWTDILRSLNWIIILMATLPGVYLLAVDVDREERQGTLNFIRLSPQSGHRILMGKLMGVPILMDLAIALLVPLQVWAAIQAHAPLTFLLSFYLLLEAGCFFLFSFAILGGFLSKLQTSLSKIQIGPGLALALVMLTLMGFLPAYMTWNMLTAWHPFALFLINTPGTLTPSTVQWFYLPLGQNIWLAHGFTLLNLALGSFWIWHAIIRCYHSPGNTLFSKTQSYSLVLYGELMMMGFFLSNWDETAYYSSQNYLGYALVLSILNIPLFLGLMMVLSNHRQSLLDWARFRHFKTVPTSQNTEMPRRHRPLWMDLLRGEKSPANLAIAFNLLVVGLLLCLWVATWPQNSQQWKALLGIVLSLNMLAIYGTLVQWLLLMKDSRRAFWACGITGIVMALPLAIAAVYYNLSTTMMTQYLLFTPIPLIAFLQESLTLGMVFKALFAQWAVLALLNGKFTLQLRQAGESASKSLLTGSSKPALSGK